MKKRLPDLLGNLVRRGQRRICRLGITHFNMIYYDALGDSIYHPIMNNGEISSVEINVTVENVAAYDENYSRAYWRQIRMVARNLKNR